jgi:hypothetical protein
MALPLIPIIMAVAALGSGIVQGISNAKNAKSEAEAVAQQLQAQAGERARQAKKLMQQQKTSFLKSGVYFDSGSPLAVLDETFDTMNKDINDMSKDANAKINNLMRQGKTAFYSSIVEGIGNAALGYFMGGGKGLSSILGKSSTTTVGSLKSKLSTTLQNVTGKYRGSFNQTLPTSNGLPSNNGTLIS